MGFTILETVEPRADLLLYSRSKEHDLAKWSRLRGTVRHLNCDRLHLFS